MFYKTQQSPAAGINCLVLNDTQKTALQDSGKGEKGYEGTGLWQTGDENPAGQKDKRMVTEYAGRKMRDQHVFSGTY